METVSRGVINARNALLQEMALQSKHESAVARVQEVCPEQRNLKLHLGCGFNIRPGWVNIDLLSIRADLSLDLREPWPFPDCSVEAIYSEHMFEHLAYPTEVQHVLQESCRVLYPGGIFEVGVPDTDWVMQSWSDPVADYWKYARELFHPPTCRTRMEHVNHHFRQDGQHLYAWDWETLRMVLRDAGFVEIRKRPWGDGDSPSRKLGTLYVSACNPINEEVRQ